MANDNQTSLTVAILVGHGERGGARSNALLVRQAEAAADANLHIIGGVLNGSPSFEDAVMAALEKTDEQILIYPFFMSAGYFVEVVLPRKIAELGATQRCRVLPPFGADARIVPIMDAIARSRATADGLDPVSSRLLLVGHGSRSGATASAIATRRAAAEIARLRGFHCVDVAFLEERPLVGDVLPYCGLPTIVMGFFSGDGLHAGEDVPAAIAEWGQPAVYTGPIGASDEVPAILSSALKDAAISTGFPAALLSK